MFLSIVMSSILVVMLVLMILVAFFAFDNLIIGGVFGRALKRWAVATFESDCTGNCNQGRNCTCVKK